MTAIPVAAASHGSDPAGPPLLPGLPPLSLRQMRGDELHLLLNEQREDPYDRNSVAWLTHEEDRWNPPDSVYSHEDYLEDPVARLDSKGPRKKETRGAHEEARDDKQQSAATA